MSDVFISYSRKNSEFARKLIERLTKANKDSWVDWEGIPLTAPNWWSEIKAGIENSDSFIFIMSPDSMASVVCNMELDYAIELGKRIVPVMYMAIESREAFGSIADFTPDEAMEERLQGKDALVMARDNWNRLSHINWLFFRDEDDFDSAFDSLITTVETDLDYVKAHTRYLTRAQEWQRNEQRSDLLLFGEEIDRAENWLIKAESYATKQSTDKETVVNPLAQDIQHNYIALSRKEDTRRKRLARSAQFSIAILAIVLIVGAIIGITALNGLNTRIDSANSQLGTATQALNSISTQVADSNNQLVTATRVAELEAEAQVTLGAVNTLVADAIVTVTESAINFEIVRQFANTILQQSDNNALQLQEMTILVERYPQEALVYLTRGIVHSEHENYQEAILDYDNAIQLNPNTASYYYNRGNAYQALENYEQAINDYDNAIELNPDDANIFYNRASAYLALGDYQNAINDYDHAIELNPDDAVALYNRGNAFQSLGDYQQAIHNYDSAIELNHDDAVAFYNRGNAYLALEDYRQAIDDYNSAIELNPDNAIVFYNRGSAYQALEDYPQAINDFDNAIQLNPDYSNAFYNRGSVYQILGDYQQAIEDYERVIELKSDDASVYNNRGNAYLALGDYQNAINDYDRAIQLNPDDATTYNNRGTAYQDLGDYRQAIDDFDSAIDLNPGYSNAYSNRGNAYLTLEDYSQAVNDYDRAIELNPDNALAYNNRGNAYQALGDYQQAIDNYELALDLDAQYIDAYYNRGLAYLSQSEFTDNEMLELALSDFSVAISIGDTNSYLTRAVVHSLLGNYQEALDDFEVYEASGAVIPDNIIQYRDEAQRIVDESE